MKRITAAFALAGLLLLGPVSARASERQSRQDILITRNGEFDAAHGVRSGKGTVKNPYVISGWSVHNINIQDTSKAVRIVDNEVHSTMTLNWIGRNVTVMDNDVNDLRVNENIPRWGAPTSAMIEHNHFNVVGQIRHFDGHFMYNTVGSADNVQLFGTNQAVNFDGFNGAHFAYNTIYGYVDARLHGHHHSSKYGEASHMHSGSMDAMADHTQRYHEVFIDHNHIVAPGSYYALAFLDTNHADNDRTAASETNPELNSPHVHYTRVHITNNVLEGAGIMVDVFNSADELHKKFAKGLMEIAGNRITLQHDSLSLFQWVTGIQVLQARSLALKIDRNTINAPVPEHSQEPLKTWEMQGAGIWLNDLTGATVSLANDRVTNLEYGISASQMTRTVGWTINRLSTSGVMIPVSYDSSVANRPRQG